MKNIINKIYETKSLAELNTLKEEINEAITKHTETMILKENAFKVCKGSLGSIKESFENMAPELFKLNEGRKLIAQYKTIVKENKSLSTALNVFENFRKAINENTVNFIINDIEKYTKNINGKKLNEGIDDLRSVLFSAYILLGESAAQYCLNENEEYNKSIMYILENKRKLSNTIDFANASEVIKECIKRRGNEIDSSYNKLIENIEEAFKKRYTDDTINSLNIKPNDKELAFETYKRECMNKINEVISSMENNNDTDGEELSKIKSIYEQVSVKKYSAETVNNDITNLIGIAKCFE